MPPANSPTDTPLPRPHHDAFFESISHSVDPVAHLASTLISQEELDADDDNVNFLRTTLPAISTDSQEEPVTSSSQRRRSMENLLLDPRITQSERDTVRRLRRYVLQGGRSLSPMSNSANDARGSPSLRNRSERRSVDYQGWAPGSTETDVVEQAVTLGDLRALARGAQSDESRAYSQHLQRLRSLQVDREQRGQQREQQRQQDDSRGLYPVAMDWQPHSAIRQEASDNEPRENPLRTTALLHSVRRHARFSPWPWPAHQDSPPNLDIERARRFMVERDRATDHTRQNLANEGDANITPPDFLPSGAPRNPVRLRARRSTSSSLSEGSKWLEEAIKYLERLRSHDTSETKGLGWMDFAQPGGFVREHFFTHKGQRNDFVMDTSKIQPPAPSSWLREGSVFSGNQKSTNCMHLSLPPLNSQPTARRHRGPGSDHMARALTSPNSGPLPRVSWMNSVIPGRTAGAGDAGSVSARTGTGCALPGADESWPVKVTITSVDYDRMRLTGTMEAFDVPNKTCPHQHTTIATYLEGEIIDFQQYALETTSFNAGAAVDSTYWRELEPFRSLSDSEIVHNLLSAKWLCEELSSKFILMRWKEKCFITPSDAQVHLTISGFYYVSLKRDDGRLEGLYYDPTSTPYQHLVLRNESRMFPSYKFR